MGRAEWKGTGNASRSRRRSVQRCVQPGWDAPRIGFTGSNRQGVGPRDGRDLAHDPICGSDVWGGVQSGWFVAGDASDGWNDKCSRFAAVRGAALAAAEMIESVTRSYEGDPAHCTSLGCGSRTSLVSMNIAPLRDSTIPSRPVPLLDAPV